MELDKKDLKLIELAKDIVKKNKDLYEEKNLIVGAVVKASSGKIYKGINLKTSHSVCAEQVAIGQAFAEGERQLDTIVAVKYSENGDIKVVSPCGLCRYIMDKLETNLNVIVIDEKTEEVSKVNINELLPYPYNRN